MAHESSPPVATEDRQPIYYRLDPQDRILELDGGWEAPSGDGPADPSELQAMLGHEIWDYLREETTTQLYRALLDRIRTTAQPVRFHFRCDSPTERRMHLMRIEPGDDGTVSFAVEVAESRTRAPVLLLDSSHPRNNDVLSMCGWCKRLPDGEGGWCEVEEAVERLDLLAGDPLPMISHGICPPCSESMLAMLDEGTDEKPRTFGSSPSNT